MPRVGLTGDDVVAAAAGLADEIGFGAVTMGLLADPLGVRPPSLYNGFPGHRTSPGGQVEHSGRTRRHHPVQRLRRRGRR